MNVFPSFSLPPEITQQIFGACLPDAGSRPTKRSQQAPLLLTQICKEWRAIALDTPQLWQSITVNDSTRPTFPSSQRTSSEAHNF
ncbi:hypothetical protein DFH09DRAFT_1140504 [Mycena vulgaris]|nr:hypothetical protein DFH09DRAFT_1140504 [Mycena vulgaris]